MKKYDLPPDLEITPATEQDIVTFYGRKCADTIKAWAFTWRGELVAIAGFARDHAGFTLFSDVMPGLEAPRKLRWLAIQHFMHLVDESKIPFYSAPSNELPNACKLLKRLGFVDTGRTHEGYKIYWRGVA